LFKDLSSLQVVEEFYGEELNDELFVRIENTPLDQLVELADRLRAHARNMSSTLDIFPSIDYPPPPRFVRQYLTLYP
jgi:hypothetical protein